MAYSFVKRSVSFALRYIKGYFEKNRFVPLTIPKLLIETTNICDSKCAFCANKIMKRPRQHLEMSIFKKAIDEFVVLGGSKIDFNSVVGDPLLDPYLLERARYVRKFPQFKTLGFVTTLQWLHRYDINEFFESGINWLCISCALSGRERYFEFFGVDRYDVFLKNLTMLIRENNKRGNKIRILVIIKPTNEPVESIINSPDFKMVNSLISQDLVAAVKNRSFYVDDWCGVIDLPSYLKKRPLYQRLFRPCKLLYTDLIVFSNGKIGACSCRDFEADSELILGDLKNSTIGDMWNGSYLARIRSNWRRKNRIPDICRKCRHYLY